MKPNIKLILPAFLFTISLFSLESCVVRARPVAVAVNPAPAVVVAPARQRRQKVVVVKPHHHKRRAVIIRR